MLETVFYNRINSEKSDQCFLVQRNEPVVGVRNFVPLEILLVDFGESSGLDISLTGIERQDLFEISEKIFHDKEVFELQHTSQIISLYLSF